MDEETDLRPDESIRSAHSASGASPSFTQRSAAALPLPSRMRVLAALAVL